MIHQIWEAIQVEIARHRRKRQGLHIKKAGGVLVKHATLVVEEVVWNVGINLKNLRPRRVDRKSGTHVQILPTVIIHIQPRTRPTGEVDRKAIPFFRVV